MTTRFTPGQILVQSTNTYRNTRFDPNNGVHPNVRYIVVSDDSYHLNDGRLITVRREDGELHKNEKQWNVCACRFMPAPVAPAKPVARPLNKFGQPIFEVGDRIKDTSPYPVFKGAATVTKNYKHSDESITVHYTLEDGTADRYSSRESFELHKEPETMTAIPANQAQAKDTVLVEGVLTRGPDGEGDFAIRFAGKTIDQFVPKTAIRSVVSRPEPEPDFKKGDRVRMDPSNYSFNTTKRGTVIAEHKGTYFVDWGSDGMNTVVGKNLRAA